MATVSITITSALGTSAVTKNFSAADATRIFNAYKKTNPGGTQQDLAAWVAQATAESLKSLVRTAEYTPAVFATDPVIS